MSPYRDKSDVGKWTGGSRSRQPRSGARARLGAEGSGLVGRLELRLVGCLVLRLVGCLVLRLVGCLVLDPLGRPGLGQ